MMKRSDIRFDEPIRQSYVAILLLIYKRFKILIRQIWPVIIALFIGGKNTNIKNLIFIGLIALVVVSIIFAIIGFFRFFFYINGKELIIQKGVLTKKYLNIPFDRIQTVNFEQNVIQQLFDVVGLKIDTAGSKGSEFEFEALDKPTANALRELILAEKKMAKGADITEENPDQLLKQREPILHLSFTDLLKVGVAQNHLRSFALILAFFATIYQNLTEIGMDPDVTTYAPIIDVGDFKMVILILVPIFLIVSFMISIVVIVFRYFELRLLREVGGFKVISGLLKRTEVAAVDNKIQMISWSNNPLKRLLKINDVLFRQASSVEVKAKKSINIPGCDQSHLKQIKSHYFEEGSFDHHQHHIISSHFIYWRSLYLGMVPALIGSGIIYILFSDQLLYYFIPGLWLTYIVITSFIRHHKRKYSFNGMVITSSKGMFGNFYNALKLYKIQNIAISSSIYQRRRGLANILIYTAAGSVRIPFIEKEKAVALRDYLLYKVESDKRSWM